MQCNLKAAAAATLIRLFPRCRQQQWQLPWLWLDPGHLPPAGSSSGNSPGYGLTLVAETTSGCLVSAECCATTGQRGDGSGGQAHARKRGRGGGGSEDEEALLVPEDIGKAAAQCLLEEINR